MVQYNFFYLFMSHWANCFETQQISNSVEKFENFIDETAMHLCTDANMSSLCVFVCVVDC